VPKPGLVQLFPTSLTVVSHRGLFVLSQVLFFRPGAYRLRGGLCC